MFMDFHDFCILDNCKIMVFIYNFFLTSSTLYLKVVYKVKNLFLYELLISHYPNFILLILQINLIRKVLHFDDYFIEYFVIVDFDFKVELVVN